MHHSINLKKEYIMKTKLFTFIVSLIVCSFSLIAEDDTTTRIPLSQTSPKGNSEQRPRTPDFGVPIEAYYQGGVIYLHFSEDIGCMDVNVTNITTGEQWNDSACADSSVEVIAISTTHGNYQITLESEIGTTYFGEFSL